MVLLEKEREFLKDPKSFKMGAGVKRNEGMSQYIQKLSSVKAIACFSHLQIYKYKYFISHFLIA